MPNWATSRLLAEVVLQAEYASRLREDEGAGLTGPHRRTNGLLQDDLKARRSAQGDLIAQIAARTGLSSSVTVLGYTDAVMRLPFSVLIMSAAGTVARHGG